MSRKAKIIFAFCLIAIVVVVAVVLNSSDAAGPSRLEIVWVSYTNDSSGKPVAVVEIHNKGRGSVLPLSCKVDTTYEELGFPTPKLPDGPLAGDATRRISVSCKTELPGHHFTVHYATKPWRYRAFLYAIQSHTGSKIYRYLPRHFMSFEINEASYNDEPLFSPQLK